MADEKDSEQHLELILQIARDAETVGDALLRKIQGMLPEKKNELGWNTQTKGSSLLLNKGVKSALGLG